MEENLKWAGVNFQQDHLGALHTQGVVITGNTLKCKCAVLIHTIFGVIKNLQSQVKLSKGRYSLTVYLHDLSPAKHSRITSLPSGYLCAGYPLRGKEL